ncbi:helix-turn-helix domain-containing protein [Propionispira raffinosivorans]|uniref:helix-turn-helix domain-containing protein n=1 Tax=Propionispira raffinosivorans TaxID=86959 RepID=UPI000362B161|nr:helix-turn-helix transcriptional regulator [Propionispira raffinosivorans]
MNLNQRIKTVRNHFKFNQKEFADRLGLTQSGVSWMEKDGNNISDQNIRLISSLFNINEDWLRTNEGDMLIESDDSLFTAFAEKYNLTKAEQNVARYCLQLTSTQRAEILNHVVNVAEILKTTPSIEKQKPVPNNIEQEVSDYRQELEAEKRAQLVYENSDEIKKAK